MRLTTKQADAIIALVLAGLVGGLILFGAFIGYFMGKRKATVPVVLNQFDGKNYDSCETSAVIHKDYTTTMLTCWKHLEMTDSKGAKPQ